MADATTKSDLEEENARLRALLERNGIDADTAVQPNAGLVGNLADLQRLGALSINKGATNVDDAVVIPASLNADTGDVTPAETVSGNAPPEQG